MEKENILDSEKVEEISSEIFQLFDKIQAPFTEALFSLLSVHARVAVGHGKTFEEFKEAISYMVDKYEESWPIG